MGMTTYVRGIRSGNDPEFQKMKNILLACNQAECEMPEKAALYFGESYPDLYLLEEALEIDLGKAKEEFEENSISGIIIEIDKLPPGIKKLKFCNAW